MPITAIITLVLALVATAAPFATYHYAVFTTRSEERAACKLRVVAEVKKVADQITADAAAKLEAATKAADAVPPTPTVPAELVALCKKSASCRERNKP